MRGLRHYTYGQKTINSLIKKLNAVVLSTLIILPTLSGLPLLLTKSATAVSAGDIWITAAMANPNGSEPAGEYVVLTNKSSANIDIGGWSLDTDGQSDNFDPGTSIDSSGTLKVCRGSSTSAPVDCDVNQFDMGLSNSTDQTLVLSDNSVPSNIIDQVSYTAAQASHEGSEIIFSSHTSAPIPTVTTRYVNSAGSDSGDCGTTATACRTLQYAIDQANAGNTIEIESNLTTLSQTTVDKSLTINGGGHVLTAGFAKVDNGNNSALGIQANNVTINNLVVDGTGSTNLHGINVYESVGVNINDTTIKNFKTPFFSYGLLVNSSEVTVDNLTTIGNFMGVNVDRKTNLPTTLTVEGVSRHNDSAPEFGIYVDDMTQVTVDDKNSQYQIIRPFTHVNDAVYELKPVDTTAPAAPTNLSWKTASGKTISDGGITNEYSGTAMWQDGTPTGEISDVDHYVYKYWNDIPGNQYKSGSEWPNTDGLTVFGASREGSFTEGDGVHHFCVAAVDAAGNESSCTEFTITYDTAAPTIGDIKVIASNGDAMQNAPRYNPWKVITTGNNDENGIAGVYAYVYRQDGANWTRLDPEIELGTPDQHIHYFEQSSANLDYWVSSKNADNFKDGHTYRLVVWVKDKAGNESDHTDDLTVPNSAVGSASYFSPAFTIDHTKPNTPTLISPPDNAFVNGTSITQSWSESSGDVDHYIYESYHDAAATSLRYHDSYNTTSKTANNVSDATYWWRVKAVDHAGNESDWSPLRKITVDNKAPTVTIDSATANGDGTYTISGTTDDLSDISVSVSGDSNSPHIVTPVGGAWGIITGNLAAGSHTVTATSTDEAGNVGNATPKPYDFSIPTPTITPQGSTNDGGGNGGSQSDSGGSSGPNSLAVVLTPISDGVAGLIAGVAGGLGVPGVLGTSTTQGNTGSTDGSNNSDSNDAGVKGDSTNKSTSSDTNKTDDSCFEILGVCWYWWIPVVIIVIAIIYYLSRGRGKKTQNTTA